MQIPLSASGYKFPDFNYYVSLPDHGTHEVRLLWPLVWMLPQLQQRLQGKFSGTGPVTINLLLNVESERLIKDPAQPNPVLNTSGPNNGPCICDSNGLAVYNYDFVFNIVNGALAAAPNYSTVSLTVPANGIGAQFVFDSSLVLQAAIPASNTLLSALLASFLTTPNAAGPVILGNAGVNLLASLGIVASVAGVPFTAATLLAVSPNATGGFTLSFSGPVTGSLTLAAGSVVSGFVPVKSPAHYVSFIPSCNKDECDSNWFATYLETLFV